MKLNEWKIIYFIAAGFFFFGNLIFVIFGTAVIQKWNGSTENEVESDNNVKAGTKYSSFIHDRAFY